MKERPIIFSGPMVRAILDGRKTQTRRVIKNPPIGIGETPVDATDLVARIACPYGQPGDRLWVRETFYSDNFDYPKSRDVSAIEYRASHECRNWEAGCPCQDENGRSCWRPSIHMPRWASRITLEVTGVRVERVRDIAEAGARAEGVEPEQVPAFINGEPGMALLLDPTVCFAYLWDSINAKRGHPWSANDWVWVVEFKLDPSKPQQPTLAKSVTEDCDD